VTSLFYLLALVAVIATLLCITERHPVHAIIYLVTSFFSLAIIFYLLSAPLVAVFEVIIYAGAIMVLFLFSIMMIRPEETEVNLHPGLRDWWPTLLLGAILLGAIGTLVVSRPLPVSTTTPGDIREFARTLFQKYGVAVEIVSMQLLFALVGALYLGRRGRQ
jgi:NADH-quinone oxidoreductase subunit J